MRREETSRYFNILDCRGEREKDEDSGIENEEERRK